MINGKFLCCDMHCHVYPEKIALKAVAGTDNFFGTKSEYDGKAQTLINRGTESGVDKFIIESVATTPRQVPKINRFIADKVANNSDFFVGLGTLHPESEDIDGDISYLTSLGLKGVKLHPDIQSCAIDDKKCMRIYEICEELNLPILIHTGDKRYDFSNPNRLLPVLKLFPHLTIIGAHFGGYSLCEEASEILAGNDNLYVDCSSSFFALKPDTSLKIIKRYGADRVMFGSDFPMWDAGKELDYLLKLGLSDDELRQILYTNAEKVFKL